MMVGVASVPAVADAPCMVQKESQEVVQHIRNPFGKDTQGCSCSGTVSNVSKA